MALLKSKCGQNFYVADKAAWILSAVIGHLPRYFTESDVKTALTKITSDSGCTDLGKLEAITNFLKSDKFRSFVWEAPGVKNRIFKVDVNTSQAQELYKCVFAI